MWFGTEAGLNRYDGRVVTVYRHDVHDPSSLPSDFVWAHRRGRVGRPVGGHGGRRPRALGARERPLRPLPGGPEGRGRARERPAPDRPCGQERLGLGGHEGCGPRPPGSEDRPLADVPRTTRATRRVWPTTASTPCTKTRRGKLWVGTNGGLSRFDAATDRFESLRHDPSNPRSLSADSVRGIHEDREGRLWVATFGGGLDVLRQGQRCFRCTAGTTPQNPRSLADDCVHAVCEDSAGRLWVATRGGLQLREADGSLRDYRTRHRRPQQPGGQRRPVAPRRSQRRALVRHARRRGRALEPAAPGPSGRCAPSRGPRWPRERLRDLVLRGRAGRLWVGTMGGGLHDLDRRDGPDAPPRRKAAAALSDDRVMALLHDREGGLWVGTMEGGLSRLRSGPRPLRRVPERAARPGSLSANGIMALLRRPPGHALGRHLRRRAESAGRGTARLLRLPARSQGLPSLSGDIVTGARRGPLRARCGWARKEAASTCSIRESGRVRAFRP